MKELPEGPFRVLVEDAEEQREEWIEIRRTTGVSASKVPAILGSSPFETPMSCWAWYRGDLPGPEETPQMRWGSRLQDLVAQVVADDEGLVYARDERLLQSTENPLLLATLDGWFVSEEGNLEVAEIKTTKEAGYWKDGIPQYVKDQVQCQLFVSGRSLARVAVFFRAEADHFWDYVERDDAFITHVMIPKVEEFWEMVKSGRVPKSDGLERTTWAIKAAWPKPEDGKVATLPQDMLEAHDKLQKAKAMEKKAASQKREAENQIKAAIGDAEVGRIAGSDVAYSYKPQSRSGYTVKPQEVRVLRKSKWKKGN